MKYIITLLLAVVFCVPSAATARSGGPTSLQLRQRADAKYYNEEYPEALSLYIQAMEKAAAEGNDRNYIACTGYVGNIYDAFGDNKSCVAYYLKGYSAACRVGDTGLQSSFLSNIVTAYTRMGDVASAKRYYRLFQNVPGDKRDSNYLYYLYYEKARIFTAEHRYEEALREHRRALHLATDRHMKPILQLFQMSEIGNLYVRCGMNGEAVDMGDSCVAMARKLGSGELLVNAYKMLADAYGQLRAHDSARHYRELYFSLNDSVYNIKKFYDARYRMSEYESREHNAQLSLLNQRIRMQACIIGGVAAFLMLIAVFAYVIYRKNRHLTITQRLLIGKNNDLEARERQNRKLLEEYLEQLRREEKQNHPDGAAGGTVEAAAMPKATATGLSDTDEKKLLSRIDAILNDMAMIANPEFNLQMLADAAGSNTSYVSHVINANYQKNFKTLLNERRIREACHKLTDREQHRSYTMQVVYEAVGYTNAASFIRAFKRVYGMTPSEYQRVALAENADNGDAADKD